MAKAPKKQLQKGENDSQKSSKPRRKKQLQQQIRLR